MPRRKSTPAEAPQTLDEAIAELTRYVGLDTELEKFGADTKEAIAKIKAEHDRIAKPIEEQLKIIHNRLRTWWAVASEQIVKTGQKSAELAGVKIGLRMTTPKVTLKGRTEDEAILAVEESWFMPDDLVRFEMSINKTVIHQIFSRAAALGATPDEELQASDLLVRAQATELSKLGFSVTQKEEFFLARPETLPAVETVDVREAA